MRSPSVEGVASAAAGLGAGQDFLGFSDKGLTAAINVIDTGYIRVLGMQLIAGGNVEPANINDSIKPVVINETMMREFGWNAGNAVGKQIKNFQGVTAVVKGVVRNFNYRPLSEGIKNQVFEANHDAGYIHFYVRLYPGNPARALADIHKAWNHVAPAIPIKYSFLDDDINGYYKNEQRWSSIVALAGGLSIFLASLGLLGLAALAAINRTKEIGVRKVLGASVASIIALISKGFLKLVVISFVIASPVAWYCMNKWLQGYADRITINGWVFVCAGVAAVAVAILAIGYQALKAAQANPIKSLRVE
jgi:putative ABC transport system permease protein